MSASLSVATNLLQAIGAFFVTKDKEQGKLVVNMMPMLLGACGIATLGCSFQDDEMFSVCFASTMDALAHLLGL